MDLTHYLPALHRLARILASRCGGELTPDDLVQIMCLSALANAHRLAGRSPAHLLRHCRWAAQKACRLQRARAAHTVALIDTDTEERSCLLDSDSNPERRLIEREERRAVRSWFETLIAGDRLTDSQRRHLEYLTDRAHGRSSPNPHSRPRASQLTAALRRMYPHPLAGHRAKRPLWAA